MTPQQMMEYERLKMRMDIDREILATKRIEGLWNLAAGLVFVGFAVWFLFQ